MKILYWISLSYATFGIIVENDIIMESAPIGKWMIGKNINFIKNWVLNKKGVIKQLQGD